MTPVYPSEQAEAEEEDIRPRTGLSVLGLLWVGSAVLAARGLLDSGVSPFGIGAAGLGAALPLAVARITGSRDTVPLAAWGAAVALFVGGLATIAFTIVPGPYFARLMRWVRTADSAVAALVFACGGYIVSRALGSIRRERRTIYIGSALVLALRAATLAYYGFNQPRSFADFETVAFWLVPILLDLAAGAAVVWTYARILAARPHPRRISRVFE